jgi:excisionase family DNA binding protein
MTELLTFQDCLEQMGAELLQSIEAIVGQIRFSQKKALTMEEAAVYTGRSVSNLYKLTASRAIPHYKPEGKIIYFDRLELDQWMLRNPIRTQESLEAEAATHVTVARGRKGGWA